jgi:gamma-glutamyltranspeptidase/glutathione hydrolase
MINNLKLFLVLLLIGTWSHMACQKAIYSGKAIHHPIIAEQGMVASQHQLATNVGIDILKDGGNAVDAAVAVGFALAVVLPRAGNLGGGGFMMIRMNDDGKTRAINYREIAPLAAQQDMYLDPTGDVDNTKFNQSYHSIGVPGSVAGLIYALENYGTMSIKQVLRPAIKLAKKGFIVTHDLANALEIYKDRMHKSEASKSIFYKSNGTFYQAGEKLKQKDLAKTLKCIAKKGRNAFYKGKIGQKIINDIQLNGGIMTMEDLANYTVNEIEAVSGTYKGFEVYSMPPPSSGGVHIIQMLNILEALNIEDFQYGSAQYAHLLAETMRLAFADRSEHLGDPAFWEVPVEGLTSKKYAAKLSQLIKLDSVNLSSTINPGQPADYESEETTHFSVVDKFGNMVSNTYTLNYSFGTGLVAEGTGILLNNEMGDFSAKPGAPNGYGLIGGKANAVQPGKRPLSSMTPTFVLLDNKPFLVTGSPGGSRIITTVLQIILNVIEHKMNIADATHAPRIHHQWYPDILYYDGYFNPDSKSILERKGHVIKQRSAMGSTQSIMMYNGYIYGSSDPRRPDGTTIGY